MPQPLGEPFASFTYAARCLLFWGAHWDAPPVFHWSERRRPSAEIAALGKKSDKENAEIHLEIPFGDTGINNPLTVMERYRREAASDMNGILFKVKRC